MTDAIPSEDQETQLETDGGSWNKQELSGLGLAVGALVLWLLAILAFGTAGIIIPALGLVLAVFVVLIIISRG